MACYRAELDDTERKSSRVRFHPLRRIYIYAYLPIYIPPIRKLLQQNSTGSEHLMKVSPKPIVSQREQTTAVSAVPPPRFQVIESRASGVNPLESRRALNRIDAGKCKQPPPLLGHCYLKPS